jgi:hypothetical protein
VIRWWAGSAWWSITEEVCMHMVVLVIVTVRLVEFGGLREEEC